MGTEEKTASLSTEDIVARGEDWYLQHQNELERDHWGEFVAIGLEGGEYVTHPDMYAIGNEFDKRFGNRPGYVRRIGQHLQMFG